MTGLACICFGFVLGTAFDGGLPSGGQKKRLPDLAHRTSATQKGSPQATLILTESEEKSK